MCSAVTPRPPRSRACSPGNSLGSLNCPYRSTLVFSAHFVLTRAQLSRISRQSLQINTRLFCALCPHSCAPENNFPIGHPSSNRSRPSTLNLEFFLDDLLEKKVYLVDMSILSILLSHRPGCHTLTPLEDRRPRRSTPVQELPLLDTSVRPVPAHVPRRTPCPRP
jgi:hypothetical protein